MEDHNRNSGIQINDPSMFDSYRSQKAVEFSFTGQRLVIKHMDKYNTLLQIFPLIPFIIFCLYISVTVAVSIYLVIFVGAISLFIIYHIKRIIIQKIVHSKVITIDLINKSLNFTVTDKFAVKHAKFFSLFEPLGFSCGFQEIDKFYLEKIYFKYSTDSVDHYLIRMQMKNRADSKFKLAMVKNKNFAGDLESFLNSLIN
ncbi:MAG: hypothetical protein Q8933_16000 [Bacteroidota bacterium]|nr:hypothetical protein [Bacteroidota bacterium]MDP4197145.1 hypothetical protein [Bacteroidota bacterium]